MFIIDSVSNLSGLILPPIFSWVLNLTSTYSDSALLRSKGQLICWKSSKIPVFLKD